MSDATTTTTTASIPHPDVPVHATDPAHEAKGQALAWARDFAIVGGVSAFITPFVMAGAFVGARYLVFAAAGGIVGGFVLGLLFAHLTGASRPDARRLPLWVIALVAPLLGGLWGASVGLVAALGLGRGSWDLVAMSMTLAAIAGALQLGWFWVGYLFARSRRHPTWPVVVAACLLPIIGTATIQVMSTYGHSTPSRSLFSDVRD